MDPLIALLELPEERKRQLGVEFTAAEIAQQPRTWPGTLALCREQEVALRGFLAGAGRAAGAAGGRGNSDFVGSSVERLLEQRWHAPVRAVASTELLTGMDEWLRAEEPALCISFSRSGDSSEGVAVIEEMMAPLCRCRAPGDHLQCRWRDGEAGGRHRAHRMPWSSIRRPTIAVWR